MANKSPSADELAIARDQITINTRTRALNDAMELAKIRGAHFTVGDTTQLPDATWLVEQAKVVEAYILADVSSMKPKPSIVITGAMPPPAAGFKPGD